MLKQLILQFFGLCMSIFPVTLLLIRCFKRGFSNLLFVKERNVEPACLKDPRYGKHNWVQLPTGIKMHYVEKGGDTPGKPLMVFLHGFPEFWFSWRNQLEYFSRDFWCVALDMRGYNETSKPSGIKSYAIDDIAEDVKCLIQSLGREKCILVGHDWGGAIGYGFCGKYPDMVSQYITCNLPHPASLAEQWKTSFEQILKSWYIIFFQCPYLPEIFLRSFDLLMFDEMFKDLSHPVDAEIIEAYKYAWRKSETATATINYYRNTVQYGDREASAKRLTGMKVPVFCIFGTGDKYLSVTAAKGGRKFVLDFEEHYIEGCSHWVQVDKPAEVNRAIEKYLSTRKF